MDLFFYGDDPEGATGYSRQARNILIRMANHFRICALGVNRIDESPHNPYSQESRLPFKIYRAGLRDDPYDPEGRKLLQSSFEQLRPDIFFIMGDLWDLKGWFANWLEAVQFRHKFKTIAYLSTEYPISDEEKYILRLIDYPVTHSKWGMGFQNKAGYDYIKSEDESLRHLRYIPDSVDDKVFYPLSEEQRIIDRESIGLEPDQFVIMNANRNSARKDLPALIRAYKRVKKEIPKAHLYLHCAQRDEWLVPSSRTNLTSLCQGLGLKIHEDVSFPTNFTPLHGYPDEILNKIYNCADLFISTSVSEGFGVTPVEAMFANMPVLIPGHTGFSKIAEDCGIEPVSYYTEIRENVAYTSVHPVNEDDLVNRIINAYEEKDKPISKIRANEQAIKAKEQYASDNVYKKYWHPLLSEVVSTISAPPKKAILFVQHSSAGDVFISTSCFKGLKERHKGYPLHYMTQTQYQDIIKDNIHVDMILDYRPSEIHDYEFVYKPHEDRILRGNWGLGDVRLWRIYSTIIGVPFDKPIMNLQMTKKNLPDKYIVVHTTSHPYRSYPNFHVALEGCLLPVVQIGDTMDQILGNGKFEFIDMRGLSPRESAFIIAKASGFVGIDSFPMHVAGAYDIPMVIVFGCGKPAITSPETNGPHIWIEPDYTRSCSQLGPCFGNHECHNPCGPRHDPNIVRSAIRKTIKGAFPDVREKLEKLLMGA